MLINNTVRKNFEDEYILEILLFLLQSFRIFGILNKVMI